MKRYARIKVKGGRYKRVKKSVMKQGGVVIGKGKKALKYAKPGDILFYKPEGGRRQHFAFYYCNKNGKHYQIDSSPRGHGVNITKIFRKRVTIVRMEKKIASKSRKYKKTIKELKAEYKKQLKDSERIVFEIEPVEKAEAPEPESIETELAEHTETVESEE